MMVTGLSLSSKMICKMILFNSSKDNSMRVWKMTPQHEFNCVGIGLGHTQAVSTVSWSR